jgi:hypothetical protein
MKKTQLQRDIETVSKIQSKIVKLNGDLLTSGAYLAIMRLAEAYPDDEGWHALCAIEQAETIMNRLMRNVMAAQ